MIDTDSSERRGRVLVTGGAGFIGSHLVEGLLEAGLEVVVLDDFSSGRRENLVGAVGAKILEGSILDTEHALPAALDGVQAVFHLAAVPSVPQSVRDPLLSHAVNATGTLNVLEFARQAGARRVIYAASSSATGEIGDRPRSEDIAACPRSPYAAAKYAGELYARVYAQVMGLETVSLRFFNAYGPRQRLRGAYSNVIPAFLSAAMRSTRATIYGDGNQTREFTHVRDAVAACISALHAPRASGRTLNVGSGEPVTVLELARLIEQVTGKPLERTHEPPRPEEIRFMRSDLSSSREILGIEPVVGLAEGLAETCAWFKESGAMWDSGASFGARSSQS